MTEKHNTLDAGQSLDETQYLVLKGLEPALVAAMLILTYHLQTSADQASDITPDPFVQSFEDLRTADAALRDLVSDRLTSLELELPTFLLQMHSDLAYSLSELLRIAGRSAIEEDGSILGLQSSGDMYDLCCTRVAQKLGVFKRDLAAFFFETTETGKADALDKTSTIALEIGKIGRVINMVATNASIEAARVGDAGKGFNVIADEVKILSSRVSSLSVSLSDRLN
ncbi:MAG: methyl-accepting chemotaxis protein [Pseudomonadota bacterium]